LTRLRRLAARALSLLHVRRLDRELDDEIQTHIDLATGRYVAEGLTPDEAHLAALRDFGGVAHTKEVYRELRGASFLDTLLQDLRYAARTLRNSPAFTIVAVLTLALGIGANTAIFSVVNAVVLSPLPFRDAERLAQVRIIGRDGAEFPLSDSDFVAWRDQNRTAEAVAVSWETPVTFTQNGSAERIGSASVTDRFFDVLGARAEIGRAFEAGDDKPGGAKIAVLSHAFWQRELRGDPGVIGRTVSLEGVPHTIVGIMPAGFEYPSGSIDVWQILTMAPPARRGPFYTGGVARMKPGVSLDQLRANLASVTASLKARYPGPGDWTLDAVPLQDALVGKVKPVLYVLLGAVAFLLLIATANVANLLLGRASAREREIALRGALGAARGRIVRQLVTESIVLAMIGGAAGLALAAFGTKALIALAPEGVPRLDEVRLNMPVFLFALGVSVVCGIVFGLAPAVGAARAPLVETLKEGSRAGTGTQHRRAQRAVVIAEIALALVLSVGAGLMIRTVAALQHVSPGFNADRLLTFELSLPQSQYPEPANVRTFYDTLLQKLTALAGVRSAGLTISLPPDILQVTDNFTVEGQVVPPNQSAPVGPLVMVSDSLFRAFGVPLIRGRFFDERDEADAPPVAIISETLAKKYFAGLDPIGRHLKEGGPDRPVGPTNPWMTVVGVVGDVKYSGLDSAPEPAFYMPYRQNPWRGQFVVVRTASDPRMLLNEIRAAVASLDKGVPIARVKTMDDLMGASMAPSRFRATLVGIFAVVGLVLAAVGIYGVMAYAVAGRTHELGVRIALGADQATLLRLVLGEAAALVAAGIALGLSGAFAVTRMMQTLLFGVTPTDAATFAGISALLAATALAASYVPTRRALRVDPMIALRGE
jgi:predicted permease